MSRKMVVKIILFVICGMRKDGMMESCGMEEIFLEIFSDFPTVTLLIEIDTRFQNFKNEMIGYIDVIINYIINKRYSYPTVIPRFSFPHSFCVLLLGLCPLLNVILCFVHYIPLRFHEVRINYFVLIIVCLTYNS